MELEIHRNFLNPIKDGCENPTANMKPKSDFFSPKINDETRMSTLILSTLLCQPGQ